MTRYGSPLLVLLLISSLYAGDKPGPQELEHKIETAHGGKKVELLLQLAHDQVEQADRFYHDGDTEKAFGLLKNATSSADQATNVSLDSGKRLKESEIDLRKLSEHIQAMRQEANFEDRQPFDQCVQSFEQDRSKLLDRMFKK